MTDADVLARYKAHISSPNPLPPILAAISAVTDSISSHPTSTVSEVLSLISTLRSQLASQISTPFVINSGTATFERWLIQSLGRAEITEEAGGEQETIVQFGREYVTEALREKEDMARVAARIVPASGKCEVFVPVWDEVIAEVLGQVVKKGKMPVVVLQQAEGRDGEVDTLDGGVKVEEFTRKMKEGYGLFDDGEGTCLVLSQSNFIARLGNKYSTTPRIVLATAAINCANGGVLAQSRQALASVIAKASKVSFFIAGESFRSAGIFPLQRPSQSNKKEMNDKTGVLEQAHKEGLSFIPADHIEALFVGKHVYNPIRLCDEIIKSWF